MNGQEFLLCGHFNSLRTPYFSIWTLVLQYGHLISLFLLCGYLTSLWTPYLPIRMFILLTGHLIYLSDIWITYVTFDLGRRTFELENLYFLLIKYPNILSNIVNIIPTFHCHAFSVVTFTAEWDDILWWIVEDVLTPVAGVVTLVVAVVTVLKKSWSERNLSWAAQEFFWQFLTGLETNRRNKRWVSRSIFRTHD